MSLQDIIENTDGRNIAEELEEDLLRFVGEEVIRRFGEDEGSMGTWSDLIDEGQTLIEQDFRPKSEPFEGASNYKSPVIIEGAIQFGDKAKIELLSGRDLVKGEVIGRDPDKTKSERVERVVEFQNYEINHKMPEWRGDQEALLYRLPLVGNTFKKTVFDPTKGRNISTVIHYPDFAVNQATTNIDEARSFTHILSLSKRDVIERQRAGSWLDIDLFGIEEDKDQRPQDESAPDTGSNEAEGVDFSADNDQRFFEQHCFEDLDGDGYPEPYVITVHESSSTVVKITARYTADTIIVKHLTRVESLSKAIQRQAQAHTALNGRPDGFEPDLQDIELVSINPEGQITSYIFYPSSDGTFLGHGYFHMIANLAIANNMTTNVLTDSGQIENLGGGWLAKGARKKMGPMRRKLAQWDSTEFSASDLQTAILPYPAAPPSQTLFQLNEKLEGQQRNFTLTAGGEDGVIQANTAPTTALAILNEFERPTSALLLRVVESESKEFQKLFRLNRLFTDPEEYQTVLDDPEADFVADFNSDDIDILPTANPLMSSKTQRVQLAAAELEQFPLVLQAGGNPIPIIRNYYEQIGSDLMDEIFPEAGALTPEEEQQLQAMQQAQEQANQLAAAQLEQTQTQTQLITLQLQILQEDTQSQIARRDAEIENLNAKTRNQEVETLHFVNTAREDLLQMQADIILTLEKAESEDVKNQLNTYTAQVKSLLDTIDTLERGTNDRETAVQGRPVLVGS